MKNTARIKTPTSTWHWQEPGKAWHGCGIYHLTLSQTDRTEPLLGHLTDSPTAETATVERTALGEAIVHCAANIPHRHPEVRLLQYALMPDHIHLVLQVTREMPVGIRSVARGFWQGCKAAYREWRVSSIAPDSIRNKKQNTEENLFREMPYIVPLLGRGQLDRMIRYVHDNPRRAWLKRHNPDLFKMRREIHIDEGGAHLTFSAMGNMFLLDWPLKQAVECSRTIQAEVLAAQKQEVLRNAEQGFVTITAAMNDGEKAIAQAVREAGFPLVVLLRDGFPAPGSEKEKYFKPQGVYFETCAAGKLLLLEPKQAVFDDPALYRLTQDDLRHKDELKHRDYSPLPTDSTRYRCVALNNMGRLLAQNFMQ